MPRFARDGIYPAVLRLGNLSRALGRNFLPST